MSPHSPTRASALLLFSLVVLLSSVAVAQDQIAFFDFEADTNGAPPTGWTMVRATDMSSAPISTWLVDTTAAASSEFADLTQGNATKVAFANDDRDGASGVTTNVAMVSAAFDVSAYSTVTLLFDRSFTTPFGGVGEVWARDRDGGSGAWQLLATFNAAAGAWARSTIELPAAVLSTETQVAFGYRDNGQWAGAFAVDNVELRGVDVAIQIADASGPEGDAGTSDLEFMVTILPAPTSDVTLDYETLDGTAIAGADFVGTGGTPQSFTFTADGTTTSRPLAIEVIGNLVPQENRTFGVRISNPSAGIVTRAEATGTIEDDDFVVVGSFDFEADPNGQPPVGWTMVSANDLTSAPVSTWEVDTTAAASDAFSNLTNGNATKVAFTNDDRDGDTGVTTNVAMISPQFDTSGAVIVTVDYDMSFFFFSGTGHVWARNADGPTEWVELATYGATNAPWHHQRHVLPPSAIGSQTELAFGYRDNGAWAGAFAIDNLVVRTGSLPPGFSEVSTADASIVEGDSGTTDLEFTVTLTPANESGADIVVFWQVTPGTATPGVDYDDTTTSGQLTFPDGGPASQTVALPIHGNTAFQSNRTVTFRLTAATGAALITQDTATGTIVDDDEPEIPAFGHDVENENLVIVDAASGTTAVVAPSPALFRGGDFRGDDFTTFLANNLDSGTLDAITVADGTVTPGPAVTGIPEPFFITGMSWNESAGAFYAIAMNFDTFETARLYSIDATTGVATQLAQFAGTVISVAVDPDGVVYATSAVLADPFPITLNRIEGTSLVPVGPTGLNNSFFVDMDFDALTGNLIYPNRDTTTEATELFQLDTTTGAATSIGSLDGVTLNAFGVARFRDASLIAVSINDQAMLEGDSGTTPMTFTVTLAAPNETGTPITVDYATSNGTAIAGTHFESASGTLTFPSDGTTTSQEIVVNVIGNTVREFGMRFNVVLSNVTGDGVITRATGIGSILNDDAMAYGRAFGGDFFPANKFFEISPTNPAGDAPMIIAPPAPVTLYGGADFHGDSRVDFYAVNFDGNLVHVDANSLVETVVGPVTGLVGTQIARGLTWDFETGQFYLLGFDTGTAGLYTLNVTTGAATLVAAVTPAPGVPNGLMASPDGVLYMVDTAADGLRTINKTTGVVTNVGPLGQTFRDFAADGSFGDDGVLYWTATNDTPFLCRLFSIDTSTGAVTLIADIETALNLGQPSGFAIARRGPAVPDEFHGFAVR